MNAIISHHVFFVWCGKQDHSFCFLGRLTTCGVMRTWSLVRLSSWTTIYTRILQTIIPAPAFLHLPIMVAASTLIWQMLSRKYGGFTPQLSFDSRSDFSWNLPIFISVRKNMSDMPLSLSCRSINMFYNNCAGFETEWRQGKETTFSQP